MRDRIALLILSLCCIVAGVTSMAISEESRRLKHELALARQDLDIAKHVTSRHRKECPGRWGDNGELCVMDAVWFQIAQKAE